VLMESAARRFLAHRDRGGHDRSDLVQDREPTAMSTRVHDDGKNFGAP
jgi:hypothetical protein